MNAKQQILLSRFSFVERRIRSRGATAEENERYLPYAVQVIVYVACLHSALYDLQQDLFNEGLLRHQTKRYIKEAIKLAGRVHQVLHKGIGAYSENFGKWYNEQFERAEGKIGQHILLSGMERSYNVVCALSRMAISSNEKCGRFRCPAITCIENAKRYIERCKLGINDYGIDRILERGIDAQSLANDFDKTVTNKS